MKVTCNNCEWVGDEEDLPMMEDKFGHFKGCPNCETDGYLDDYFGRPKLISKGDDYQVTYGKIKIDTRVGEIEYQYRLYYPKKLDWLEDIWEVTDKPKDYDELMDWELDRIHDFIKEELCGKTSE